VYYEIIRYSHDRFRANVRRLKCAPTIREINAQATATHSTKSSPPLRLGGVSLRQHRRQQNDTTTSLIVGSAAKWTEATIRNNNCQYLQHTTTSDVFSLQLSVSRITDPSSWGLRRLDIDPCLERNIIILQFGYDTSPRILRSYLDTSPRILRSYLDSSISGFFTLVRDTTLYSHRYE
jgi:hypothetical protein